MHSDDSMDDIPMTILSESDNFAVIMSEDIEGEAIYNIELGSVSIHLFREEWDEFLQLLNAANDVIK